MSRRMIDPQVIIKSQVKDDKISVDLNEILEKYGVQIEYGVKNVTLQFYVKETEEDDKMQIITDTGSKGAIVLNTAFTISKIDGNVYIRGLLVDDLVTMNFIPFIMISNGDYENGITLSNTYEFDVHVIKV